jgi:hypothetical protein
VAGAVLGGCGLLLQAEALRSPLTSIQPLLLSALVFALPVRAVLERRAPSWSAVGSAALLASGLALFALVARPDGQTVPDEGLAALLVLTGVTLALAATGSADRVFGPRRKALLLGLATGLLFGLAAGLVKMVTAAVVTEGLSGAVDGWPLFVAVGLGAWALVVNRRAVSLSRPAVSTPVVTMVSLFTAIVFGKLVFGEQAVTDGCAPLLEAAGLAAMALGVLLLARTGEPEAATARVSVSLRRRTAG